MRKGSKRGESTKLKPSHGYDSLGRLVSAEDAVGNESIFAYDAWGTQIQVTYADGFHSTTTYNDIARKITTTDPESNSFIETFDVLGRVLTKEQVKPGGNMLLAQYTYDYAGNILQSTDANGETTTYAYDTLGRLTQVTNAKNEVTEYDYDSQGHLLTITYPDLNILTKEYDELGRMVKRIDPAGHTDKYSYDHNGNLEQRVDRKNQQFTFNYNSRNWLTSKVSDDETISFVYDAAGRRTSMVDGTGTTSYDYEASTGLLNQVTYPDNKTLQYFFDENGKRQQLTDPFDGNVYYDYDERNRLKNVGQTMEDADATYHYYKNGLLQQIEQLNGVTSNYAYEGLRLDSLTHKKSDQTVLNTYTYGYDNNGNILTRGDQNGTSDTFTYDELNRVMTSTQFDETYTYNSRGNRTSETSNLFREELDTDYVFDDRDRLTSVTVDGQTVTYKYNGDNLLYERTENGETTRYYYDGQVVIAEATVANGIAELKARYIRGRGLVAQEDTDLTKAFSGIGYRKLLEILGPWNKGVFYFHIRMVLFKSAHNVCGHRLGISTASGNPKFQAYLFLLRAAGISKLGTCGLSIVIAFAASSKNHQYTCHTQQQQNHFHVFQNLTSSFTNILYGMHRLPSLL